MNYPFDPTPEQRANLERLALHLSLDVTNMRFDMRCYCMDDEEQTLNPRDYECGTAACAVGHGPSLGIQLLLRESWSEYAGRAFGADINGWPDAFDWMFSAGWYWRYPTARDAADRIRYALRHGIPENVFAIQCGEAPLPYRPSAEAPDEPKVAKPRTVNLQEKLHEVRS